MGFKGIHLLWVFLAVLHVSNSADPLGQDFITVFMQNRNLNSGGKPSLKLYLTGITDNTQVSISVNTYSFRKKIELNAQETKMVEIDTGKEMAAGDYFTQTTIINSDQDISVLSFNSKYLSTDTSIVYPLPELGTEYYILTPPDGPPEARKEFAVVAFKDSVTVSIYPTGDITFKNKVYPAGKKADFYLEAYYAFEMQSKDDLSGTWIVSTRPVAVLSGNTCAKRNTNCNHVYEQLLPVSSWQTEFVVPPMSFQVNYDLVYIVAAQSTSVSYWDGSSKKSRSMTAGDVLSLQLSTARPLYINATNGIQVMYLSSGFSKSGSSYSPFLINVPDVYSWCTTYNIHGMDQMDSYALIVAKSSATAAITYDKAAINGLSWKQIPGSGYSWSERIFAKESGYPSHLVEHPSTPFGFLLFAMSKTDFYAASAICPSKPSCRKTKCRKQELCAMKDDQPVCYPKSEAVCWAWGDPHYHTFDGKDYDFQGTCRYTIAKTCGKDMSLPFFNVESKNENRGTTAVSYVSLVFVQVYGFNITAVRSEHGFVRVNDQRYPLPISVANGKIQMYHRGGAVVIQPDFALKVLYDWNMYLEVRISSSYYENVCGLCGNYNGGVKDEFLTPGGVLTNNAIDFGRSWKVDDGDSSCWDDCNGQCPDCSSKVVIKYKSKDYCGLMSTSSGPFKMCIPAVDPKPYRGNCAYDMCYTGGFQQTLCNALKTYADACWSKGKEISDWRSLAECPMPCPDNSHYEVCGSACQATCNDNATPADCANTCLETCICNKGYVLNGGICLPKSSCGCIAKGGLQYKANETFWKDDKCHEQCFCNPDTNKVECTKTKCKTTEKCNVVNGIRDCYPTSYGTCSASGDPHYITLDGVRYDFQGTCRYLFSGLCSKSDDLMDFQVFIENEHRGTKAVAYTKAVQVQVYNTDIKISKEYPDTVMVNNLRITLPYSIENGKLSIFRTGFSAVVQTNFGLRVTFNWDSRVAVTVPGSYGGAVCGLCGDFNGSGKDELTMRNGDLAQNANAFGQSWKVGNTLGCTENPPKGCDDLADQKKQQREKKMVCEVILDPSGPFRDCIGKVDSEGYFTDCVYDYCVYKGKQEITCQAVASYAEACQEAGATIYAWRSDSFCSVVCPKNSHYEVCTSDCATTCLGLSTPAGCTTTCKEGCVCDEGNVLSGDQCVQISDCGCSYNGVYYKSGDTFLPSAQCSQQCTCNPGGIVDCKNFSCGHNEECKVLAGIQKCEPAGTAMCCASGDPHLKSFDGLYFDFQGTCKYTMAKSCAPDGSTLIPFAVSIENEKWGNGKVAVVKLVAVDVYGYTLILKSGKTGLVMVNGVYYNLPLNLEHGKVRVLRYGVNFLVKTDFGLQVSYDLIHHATVIVPKTYAGVMCGLCGNYNGNKTDEFLRPDTNQAKDAAEFGTSWKVPIAGVTCGEGCGGSGSPCPPCDENKKKDYQSKGQCGILAAEDGPFKDCYSKINPQVYFDNCVFDLCAGQGDNVMLCNNIQAYVTACQGEGIIIQPWRSDSFCPMTCPDHGHYSLCADTCSASCSQISDTSSCPTTCAEGCECDEGYVDDGLKCVPMEECGCFEDGEYYQPNESILNGNCTEVCTCSPTNGVTCKPHSCNDDEKCTILNGVVSCVPQDPCKKFDCRKKEKCMLQDGSPVCVPNSESTCWVWGDPHYHTLDGRNYDFHGTCTYTMARTCGADDTLPWFNVEAKNENRGSTAGSYVSFVTVQVYGYNITLVRYENGHARVNNQDSLLPITLNGGKIQIYQSGSSVFVATDFTLTVIYDWNYYLEIRVSSSFYNSICGLCGNYNENPNDDFTTPSGDLAPSQIDFGKSWKVEDGDTSCWHDCNGKCKECSPELANKYKDGALCGLLTKLVQGPFKECQAVIDPQVYIDNCVYDMCKTDGYKQILCNTLKAYADACQRANVHIDDWRVISKCSSQCPENSNYKSCGSACPATCNGAGTPTSCSSPCVETCECDEGYVLSEGNCIRKGDCGCIFQGLHYPPNEKFWLGGGCEKQCVCDPSTGNVECNPTKCKSSEQCDVRNGIRDCYPTKYGTCSSSGDPHYITFDNVKYNFQGTCVYLFAGLCPKTKGLIDFQVYVQNEHRASIAVAYTKAVEVVVYNTNIYISKEYPDQVMVNGVRINLPYSGNKGKLSIFKSGFFAVVQTNFGLRVTFNWESRVAVTVPTSYAGAMCGLCGDFNGSGKDELTMKNGEVAQNATAFGQSWTERDLPGCNIVIESPCNDQTDEKAQQIQKKTECGLIIDPNGPFRNCLAKVDPEGYFTDCAYDACIYKGRQEIICQTVASYAEACQEAGVTVYPWRSSSFCTPVCPINSHYDVCTSECATTCYGLSSPTGCTTSCKEGCSCDDGYVLNGGQCVRISECGCSYNSVYYTPGQTFFPSKLCNKQCTCTVGGTVECKDFSCSPNEECKVVDGIQKCEPVGVAMCSASGDPHYRSFDGVRFDFQGTCTYTLAKTCIADKSSLIPFSVSVENEKWGNGKVATTKLVAVDVYGYTLLLAKGNTGLVKVNGVLYNLPIRLENGKIRVFYYGINVLIMTDFNLKVGYDLVYHATVTVPSSYKGVMCGLCGNYNGNKTDEFLLPNNKLASDAVAFGSAWKVPVAGVTCGDGCGGADNPCPQCDGKKKEVYKRNNYCGILTVDDGPFSACYQAIPPDAYFNNCVYDLCMGNGDNNVLCFSIQSYVTACQAAGIPITTWRINSFCPLTCPENSHYAVCADTCATSCSQVSDTSSCPTFCAEGCQCDEGYFFDGQTCVTMDDCGCFENGIYYKPGEVVISDTCDQVCTCKPRGILFCEEFTCAKDEKCTLSNGHTICINTDPCKSITCRTMETCKVEDGLPVCVPNYSGSCWGSGDYHTYDGYNFDFQGTCSYTISKYCGSDPTLVPFTIDAKNDNRGNQAVSYVSLVDIYLYGYKISIYKGEIGQIRVNELLNSLPVTLMDGKIKVTQSGDAAVLQTDFGLQVSYEWNWYFIVTIPSSYYGTTCGLCGNFNQDQLDDMMVPDGTKVTSIVDWVKSWRVKDLDLFCWDTCMGNCPTCDESQKAKYESEQSCGLISKVADGAFRECHAKINPKDFFDSCVYDVCLNRGAPQFLCQALDSYARTCRKQGVTIYDWRTPSRCTLPCGENSHYESCGSACPTSCSQQIADADCSLPCVEACQCNTGFVHSVDKCVRVEDCGCNYNGLYFEPNEEFWSDDNCHVHCKCDPALGIVVCKNDQCKTSERCTIQNGVRGCHPISYSSCTASGDPHHITLDGHRYDFQGTCVYQMAGLCAEDPTLTPFTVTVQNERRGRKTVAYTKVVTLQVNNMTLTLNKDYPRQIQVNGVLTALPFYYQKNKLVAYIGVPHAWIKTDFGLTVNYNWDNYARVMLPSTYAGAVCGLCGNYNQKGDDDMIMRNKILATNAAQFGESWKVGEVSGCTGDCGSDCNTCSETDTQKYKSTNYCDIIINENGPFSLCQKSIDPTQFFNDCVFDACQYKGHYSALCNAISVYAAVCQDKGIEIQSWRTLTFCPLTCPANSQYELCGSGCPAVCAGLSSPAGCDGPCAEGCACKDGFILSGDSCVPISDCGCVYNERYYKLGQEFYPGGLCDEQCRCGDSGVVICKKASCSANEECQVVNGVQGCHPTGSGTCMASGGLHYLSFDGRAFDFQGTCTYTLATYCGDSAKLDNFSVEVENERDGTGNLAVTRMVVVTVNGYTVTMERGMGWKVKVNKELLNLPLTINEGDIVINQEGNKIVFQTSFSLTVFYDTAYYVRVEVPSTYKGELCGLCGNYNGNKSDEFRLPNGDLEQNAEEFGTAWKVKVTGSKCSDGCGDKCPVCDTMRAAIYKRDVMCGLITADDGPFQSCHSVVKPEDYFNHCVYDVCAVDGTGDILCKSLQAYAAACQAAGAVITSWREASSCPLTCADNSHYELCTRTCDFTCAGMVARSQCTDNCFEGCQCNDGFVFSGDSCVSIDTCGCVYNGMYLKFGESIVTTDCKQKCTCGDNGGVQCEKVACREDEACAFKNGMRGCQKREGQCTITADALLTSFDGLSGEVAPGSSHEVASLCDLRSEAWFRAVVDIRSCNKEEAVSAAVHVYFHDAMVSVNQDKECWVNGQQVELSANVSKSITVTVEDDVVIIKQASRVQVRLSVSGEVTVKVSEAMANTLCGACGNFNGEASDDLTLTDTKVAADMSEVIKYWRARDFASCGV